MNLESQLEEIIDKIVDYSLTRTKGTVVVSFSSLNRIGSNSAKLRRGPPN